MQLYIIIYINHKYLKPDGAVIVALGQCQSQIYWVWQCTPKPSKFGNGDCWRLTCFENFKICCHILQKPPQIHLHLLQL